jgi:hypothetical protein
MRRFVLCMALAIASVRPLGAQTMLYSTAASQARIDGYRVRDDGSLTPDPTTQKPTSGVRPRRIISRGCNLYVVEKDRVEVFRIRQPGGLELIGATKAGKDVRAHDVELWPEAGMPSTMYVPHRRQGAVAAYPLDEQGRPNYATETQGPIQAGGPLSCVFGPGGADWEDIEVENDRLYAAYTDRIEIYGILPGKTCTNSATTVCTTDADCARCETGHPEPNVLRCSNNIAIQCTTAADCAGKCEPTDDPEQKLRCSNDTATTCFADADCAPVCATGQLIGSTFQDEDGNGTIDPDETTCADYNLTPLTSTTSCIDSSVRPKSVRPNRPDPNCPFSFRGNLAGAVGLVVDGRSVVASMRFTHKLQGFTLEDGTGLFPPIATTDVKKTTKKEKRQERKCRKRNRTKEEIRYIGLTPSVRAAPTDPLLIYAAGYSGRTDTYRYTTAEDSSEKCDKYVPPGSPVLPKNLSAATQKDVTSTPVRSALGATAGGRPILYVAAGELDRIEAFRLFEGGLTDNKESPMRTNEIGGSYPNDVVLVDITSCD